MARHDLAALKVYEWVAHGNVFHRVLAKVRLVVHLRSSDPQTSVPTRGPPPGKQELVTKLELRTSAHFYCTGAGYNKSSIPCDAFTQ